MENDHNWTNVPDTKPTGNFKRIRCIKCGIQILIGKNENPNKIHYIFGIMFDKERLPNCEEIIMRKALG
jgi:hypothetical protein